MESYYTLLGVGRDATPEEIESAYLRQRERYSPERVAELGPEFGQVARERLAALERARGALLDPVKSDTDSMPTSAARSRERNSVSRRELTMLVGGALVGLLLIAAVWVFAGRTSTPTVNLARLDRPAPTFVLRDLNGNSIKLQDYIGKKTVLINFWYSKCAPCIEETPALQQVYQKLAPDGLVVIGVNVRGNEQRGAAGDEDVRKFTERFGVTYPVVFDDKGEVGRAYQVLPLPSSFFIDSSGTIRYASYSTVTASEVERVFNELQRTATR